MVNMLLTFPPFKKLYRKTDIKKDKSHAEMSDKRMQDKAQKGSIEEILTNEGFEEF